MYLRRNRRPRFDKTPIAVKPRPRRLGAILDGDNVAIIATNLKIQAGIPQDRISR